MPARSSWPNGRPASTTSTRSTSSWRACAMFDGAPTGWRVVVSAPPAHTRVSPDRLGTHMRYCPYWMLPLSPRRSPSARRPLWRPTTADSISTSTSTASRTTPTSRALSKTAWTTSSTWGSGSTTNFTMTSAAWGSSRPASTRIPEAIPRSSQGWATSTSWAGTGGSAAPWSGSRARPTTTAASSSPRCRSSPTTSAPCR